jgi:hypothetical protein
MARDDCSPPSVEVPSCSLDAGGLRNQGERYAAIGRTVVGVERSPRSLVVDLGPSADRALVEETLRIERECCPFFDLDYDPDRRRLSVAVASEEMDAAIDAIAAALGASDRLRA